MIKIAKKSRFKKEIIGKMSALLTAAFGLVAALAWNDAIKALFREGGPLYGISTHGPWGYAILVTIIAVIVTIWMARISERVN